jgi:thymidylate kinase
MLITFSGLDGAGKSTLTTFLQRELASHRRRSVVYHMNKQVGLYAYLRVIRNLVAASPNPAPSEWTASRGGGDSAASPRASASGSSRQRGRRSALVRVRNALVWNKGIRRVLYPIDLAVFLCYRLYVERVRRHVLIMDRYFYDTIVDVSDGQRRLWVRLLEWITPKPDVAVYIDVEPEVAFARKGEYTIDYLRRRHERYRAVFTRVHPRLMIASGDLAASKAALRTAVLEKLAG